MKSIFFRLAVLAAFVAAASCFGQESRSDDDYSIDESIFNVPEGSAVGYYQSLQRELQEAFLHLPQDEAAALELRDKIGAALRDVNRNLAYTCPNATERIADAAFDAYCRSLSMSLAYQELREVLAKEKERVKQKPDRIAFLEDAALVAEITSYGRAKDSDALAALGDRLIDDALAEPGRSERYSSYVAKMRAFAPSVADAFVAKAEEKFNATDDRALQRCALSLRGEERRKALVGAEMKLEGLTVLGKEFDWATYSGKTVLVVFFGSGNRQTVDLFRVPLSIFSDYRDSGFEIVGYLVDDDPKSVEMFDRRYPYPWTTLSRLLSREAKDKEYVDPTAYYDLQKFPTAFLIGKDGKVVDVNATNEEVLQYLQEQFPNVE